jgi:undecaprenyl-diphosphatase
VTVDLHGPLEERLFRALNADVGPLADQAAVFLSSTALGVAFALVLLVAFRRLRPDRWPRLAAALLSAFAVSDFVGHNLWRPLVGRMRPCYALAPELVRQLVPAANVGSIPSLHAANFFALATVAAAADRRLGLASLALAAAVAWARVHGGVHWPSDVLAGAAWGALCGAGARWVLLRGVRPAAPEVVPAPRSEPPRPPGPPVA